jgi:C-terminal processing protease CtpA/Prc
VSAIALVLAFFPSTAKAQIPLAIAIEDTPNGVFVTTVFQGGIADRCMPRLRQGARIVTVNGEPLKSAEQFRQVVDSSTFVRFEFVDVTGERRWAKAWIGRRMPLDCGP